MREQYSYLNQNRKFVLHNLLGYNNLSEMHMKQKRSKYTNFNSVDINVLIIFHIFFYPQWVKEDMILLMVSDSLFMVKTFIYISDRLYLVVRYMDLQKTGKFISNLRKEKGLTQGQLGEKLGVTNKTVSRWETGKYLPLQTSFYR